VQNTLRVSPRPLFVLVIRPMFALEHACLNRSLGFAGQIGNILHLKGTDTSISSCRDVESAILSLNCNPQHLHGMKGLQWWYVHLEAAVPASQEPVSLVQSSCHKSHSLE